MDIDFNYGGSSVFNGRFEEIYIVSSLVARGFSLDRIRKKVLDDNILGIRSFSYRSKVWSHIHFMWLRYPWWYVRFISNVMISSLPDYIKRLFAYKVFLRRARVLRATAVRFLRSFRFLDDPSFSSDDLEAFFYRSFPSFRKLSDSMQREAVRKAITFFSGLGFVSTGRVKRVYLPRITEELVILSIYDWFFMEKRRKLEEVFYIYLLMSKEIEALLRESRLRGYLDENYKPLVDKELVADKLSGGGLIRDE